MVHIQRLHVHLPESFRSQAGLFATFLAEDLLSFRPSQPMRLDTLQIGPIALDPQGDIRATASQAAAQLRRAVERHDHES